MADAYEVNVAPHNFYSPLATMMSLQLCAVAPNVRIMEMDVDQAAWVNDLVTVRPVFCDGYLALPTGPGWGTEVNEEAVKAHPYGGATGGAR
jgi:L-alanine-DL-glutamate epimerase-like enolase superfamily enzyme